MKRQPVPYVDSWDAVSGLIAKILDRPSESLRSAVKTTEAKPHITSLIRDGSDHDDDLALMGRFAVSYLTKHRTPGQIAELLVRDAEHLGLISIDEK